MRIRLLEIEQILAAVVEQAVDIEHVHSCLRILQRHSFLNHRGTDEVSEADCCRSGAEERYFSSSSFVPLRLAALIIPASTIPAVPWMSSL